MVAGVWYLGSYNLGDDFLEYTFAANNISLEGTHACMFFKSKGGTKLKDLSTEDGSMEIVNNALVVKRFSLIGFPVGTHFYEIRFDFPNGSATLIKGSIDIYNALKDCG